jgi:predicted nucleotidyltransferase
MIIEERIQQVATRIGNETGALQVILFGSHARGEAGENSDVDLMIIAESDLPRFKRSREIYQLFKPYPFGMDLLVYTPEEVRKGKRSELSFVSNVLREGKILYDRQS